jgi:hypothetical protein
MHYALEPLMVPHPANPGIPVRDGPNDPDDPLLPMRPGCRRRICHHPPITGYTRLKTVSAGNLEHLRFLCLS